VLGAVGIVDHEEPTPVGLATRHVRGPASHLYGVTPSGSVADRVQSENNNAISPTWKAFLNSDSNFGLSARNPLRASRIAPVPVTTCPGCGMRIASGS
jgi:hypothetical protein